MTRENPQESTRVFYEQPTTCLPVSVVAGEDGNWAFKCQVDARTIFGSGRSQALSVQASSRSLGMRLQGNPWERAASGTRSLAQPLLASLPRLGLGHADAETRRNTRITEYPFSVSSTLHESHLMLL